MQTQSAHSWVTETELKKIEEEFRKQLSLIVNNNDLSKEEEESVLRLWNFFWEIRALPKIGLEFRWKDLLRLCANALGCRERWLQGELCLEGYGVENHWDAEKKGKHDFSYPPHQCEIEVKAATYPIDGQPNKIFPYEPVELIGELKIWAGGIFKEPEGVRGLLNDLEAGKAIGAPRDKRKPKEERWGLLTDYFRLREANTASNPKALRLLVLVVDERYGMNSTLWGKFVCHSNLNFVEAIRLPDFVRREGIWIRAWKIFPPSGLPGTSN